MKTIKEFHGFRKDVQDYFSLSGIRESKKLNHHPFVVFRNGEAEVVKSIDELLSNFEDGCDVIAQWGGQYRSDYFTFKVGDLRKFIKENPKKDYHEVIDFMGENMMPKPGSLLTARPDKKIHYPSMKEFKRRLIDLMAYFGLSIKTIREGEMVINIPKESFDGNPFSIEGKIKIEFTCDF